MEAWELSIRNQQLLAELAQLDDCPEADHAITHYAVFGSSQQRQQFALHLQQAGGQWQGIAPEPGDDDEYPWAVRFDNKQPATPEAIDRTTAALCALAAQYEGRYEGWGTAPVHVPAAPAAAEPPEPAAPGIWQRVLAVLNKN